jgi:hypothetical protein
LGNAFFQGINQLIPFIQYFILGIKYLLAIDDKGMPDR